METTALKKISTRDARDRLTEMARHLRKTVRVDIDSAGKKTVLPHPTILRPPVSSSTGEVAMPEQIGERVTLSTARPLGMSDFADTSGPPIGCTKTKRLSSPVTKKPTAPKKSSAAEKMKGKVVVRKSSKTTGELPQKPRKGVVIGEPSPTNRRTESRRETERRKPSPARKTREENVIDEAEVKAVCEGARSSPFDETSYYNSLSASVERRAAHGSSVSPRTRKKRSSHPTPGGSPIKRRKAAGESGSRTGNPDPDEAARKGQTSFELPLYDRSYIEQTFNSFTCEALAGGLHNLSSEMGQAVILSTHVTHSFFRVA